jgi:DNA replication protein DnaC
LQAEYARTRLEAFLSRRPAKLATPGALDPRLVEWARQVAQGLAGNLVITGNTGTGKSWSAWRIGEELLRHGWRGRVEITTAYRIKQLATPPADMDEIARLASADLLTLDDIGAVRVSDWDADHLYALVDERWASERPTIVVTNATAPREDGKTALQALLGDRVASRIADGVTVVAITGQDRRRAS